MSLAKWQKVIWKVRDSQHSLDWLLNRQLCLLFFFFCVCFGSGRFTGMHACMCPHVPRGTVCVFVFLHERICELLSVCYYTCCQSPQMFVCVCCHVYSAAVLIPEYCSMLEVRPWEASSLSLLLNQIASQLHCTKSISLWLWHKGCWCKSQGLGVVPNLMSQPAGSQPVFCPL